MKIELLMLLALGCSVTSLDTDEDIGRPYEFGFTIDGQQHRHESKDVNGIIQGEFGFITADGVYHVTVYATDENGSFKILSMRNIKISDRLDKPGVTLPAQIPGVDQANPSAVTQAPSIPITQAPTTNPPNYNAPYSFTTPPSLKVKSCGSCKLPSTTPRPPGASRKLPFQTPAFQNSPKQNQPPTYNQQRNVPGIAPPSVEQQPPFTRQENNKQLPGSTPNDILGNPPGFPTVQEPNSGQNSPPFSNIQSNPGLPNPPIVSNIPSSGIANFPVQRTPKQYEPITPITVSNQMINIPGRDPIPIKDPYPNMRDGLPAGITQDDMLNLLYKFNYTLGFHGHHEKGLKNGAKIGGYFVNGRDGFSRVVEYIADENGFRPKFKLINLGLDSPDTPKEGSEKKFGLKGFEFVWYPV